MELLLVGLVLFVATHSVRIVADGWRTSMLQKLGFVKWRAAYSVLAIAGFVMLVKGFAQARDIGEPLWQVGAGRGIASGAMLLSLIGFTASVLRRSHVAVWLRHPQLCSVIVFCLAHLAANAQPAHLLLFGALLAWAVCDLFSALGRDRRDGRVVATPQWAHTVANLAIGVGIWFAFARWIHQWLIGVSPL